MEKVLSAGPESGEAPKATRVLEVNAAHPVFEKLKAAQDAGDKERLSLYAGLLYDQALLVEGIMPTDPVAFASQVCELM
jgi:molecular chaperone HtpG